MGGAQAEELLSAGREKQRKNEHNGAVMLYEKALKEVRHLPTHPAHPAPPFF